MKEQKGKSWENLLRWKSWGKIGEYLIEMQSLVVWKPLCWMYYLFKLPKFWVITSPIRGDQGKVVLGPQTTVTKLICWGAKFEYYWKVSFSSPHAKCAGPKGLRAESARAFTGRRNSHSGRGEDFLTGQLNFFTETAVTPERKVEKWFPRWEINRHAEG